MLKHKAYKYRIYPNSEQKILIHKSIGCSRFTYNELLKDYLKDFEETGKVPKETSLVPLKEKFTFLKEVHSHVLCNAQRSLIKAFKNHKSNPKHFGEPKFKSKKRSRASYTVNNLDNKKNPDKCPIRIEGKKIRLPKIGLVRLVQHRPLPEHGAIKHITISRTPTNKYFVSITVEYEDQVPKVEPKSCGGLDMVMDGLYRDSEGNLVKLPPEIVESQKQIKTAHRKLSRKEKGSKNYEKQRQRLAKKYEKLANQLLDFLNKQSHQLAFKYDLIGIEDIDLRVLAKRKKGRKFSFGKSLQSKGWGKFTHMLEYKLESQGKQLVRVGKWFPSSQICNHCQFQNSATKDLSIREWVCPQCGQHNDRDLNAAKNIRDEALRLV